MVNAPKTLKRILPTLMKMVITYLGKNDGDYRLVARSSLGDLVQKMGDVILSRVRIKFLFRFSPLFQSLGRTIILLPINLHHTLF